MNVKYMLRMQFGMKQDAVVIRKELLQLCDKAKVDEIAFFMFAEDQNDGHDTVERIGQWLAFLRPLKQALESMGVAVSLNPWHTLLHSGRSRSLKPEQNWQTMVDWQGAQADAVICPLDPGWREYYAQLMHMYADEHYRVVWIDDDMRYASHGPPLNWGGCWCPLHMNAFSEIVGRDVSRQELIDKATAPGTPHPWRGMWVDMWDHQQREMLHSWSEIIEAQGGRLGIMTCGCGRHALEGRRRKNFWESIARTQPPVIRPKFWEFNDILSSDFYRAISLMQQNNIVKPEKSERYPEIENFRYGQWSKSFTQTAAQMSMAEMFGCQGHAISMYDFSGNMPSDTPENATFLAKAKPVLEQLHREFGEHMVSVGFGIPWQENESRDNQLEEQQQGRWPEIGAYSDGWSFWLGSMGFAYSKQVGNRVNALSGQGVWMFNDEQILEMLGGGVLLDGRASELLCRRGFGQYIGLTDPRLITQGDILYSMEQCVGDELALRDQARITLNGLQYSDRLLQGALDPGARIISVLLGPTEEEVGHGAWLFSNKIGGRVAGVPWQALPSQALCVQRQGQLAAVVGWLNNGRPTGRVSGSAWLIPQFFRRDNIWRGVVWNVGTDPVHSVNIELPDGFVSADEAFHVQTALLRTSTDLLAEERCISLTTPMQQWDYIVLKGKVNR